MLLGDRALGVLGIALREPHEFSEEEVSLLQSLANHAAIAIENARLYQAAARRAARMRTLAEMGQLLVSTFEVGGILETVVTRCRESLDISDVGVFSVDEEKSELFFLRGFGPREPFWRSHQLRVGEGVAGRAVAENRPVWTEDILSDAGITLRPETRARIEAVGTRAVLAIPLGGERTFGALVVHRNPGHRFTDEEREFLTTFAHQVAVALENARLFSLEQTRRAQVEALVEIERELAAELNSEKLLDLIIERASAMLKARGVVFLLDEAGATLVPHSWYGMPPKVREMRIPVGVGIAGAAAVERRGIMANDLLNSPYAVSLAAHGVDPLGSVHVIAQPLISRDRLLGVIALNREAGYPRFTQMEFETFAGFAAQAAIALENARLYREAKEYGDRLRALDEVNRLVSSSLQVEEVLKNIAQAVSTFFEAPQAHVWVVAPDGQRLSRSVTVGDPGVAAGFPEELALGEGGEGWAVQHREPILWTRVEDPRILRRSWALRHGLRHVTAYPIMLGDRVLGAFVMYRSAPHPVTPETRSLLGSLAAQAAVALDNARLYAETARRLRETQALLEVAGILSSTLDLKRLLKQVTIKTAQVCQVDRCSIAFWEGDRAIPLMSQFADGRKAPDLWAKFMVVRPFAPQNVQAHAIAIATKRPVVIPDTSDTDLIPREWVETYGLRAFLVVPLIRQDQVVGVLNLDYTDRKGAFEQWQVDLAVTIAGQLALALENSRLYAEIRERLKETETLLAVSRVLSLNLPAQEAMRQVAREVGRAFRADMVGAHFLDARKEALVPMAGYHVPKHLLQVFLDRPFRISRFPILQEAWQTRKPAWSSDAMSDPRFDREFLEAISPRATLFAPTLVRGEIIGGLFLVWWSPGRTFTSAELRLVEGVASQVGLALENADLARQTEEKLRETETLLNVGRALSTTLELEPLLRHFLREVTRIIESDSVGVWLVDPATGLLEPAVGFRVPRNLLDALRSVRIDPDEVTFYGDGFRSKRVVVSSNVPEDPRIPSAMKAAAPHRAQLFAPIVAKGRVIGSFIAVWWDRTREFSERELALVEAMGIQAGVAVENARLFQENHRKLEELSVLHELSRAVTGQLDFAELVGAIRRQVARVLDARNMLILLYDGARQEVEVALQLLEGEERPEPRRYPVGDGLFTRLVERGRPIRTDNYRAECQREGVRPVEESLRYPYWLGVPMVAGDQTIGGLILRSNVRPFTADDERLLLNIASLAALAFRSARLFDERTRALQELGAAQDQLIRTEKLRALGEMASGVAHDFNNLLASILGRAQLLLRKVEDPKLKQWLQVIERAATDGARTVRRIQEFARIRRDQPFVPVDLNAVVREALEVTQSRWGEEAQSQGVTIDVTTALDPVPAIAGDPAELREVLTNLILNAVDAMPEGGTLSLSTRAVEGRVVVDVSDTGVGMPPEVQRQIFDPFFTTKGPKGTGLGLSITYGIVVRHGGQITVQSAEGQGSTFSLTFSVSEAEPELPSATVLPAAPPVRCLVVDDEQMVLEAMGDLLTMAGHSAVLVKDGAEAIARFKAEPFDLVLTDLAMPRVNGWQLARAVKDHDPSVPVLLVTGLGVELSAGELFAHGVAAVLSKPVRLEDILSAVATFGYRRQRPASMRDAS
ncbi:MAG: GAF domain-containing protein, partial [Candidatus Rokubacteria bacterium]|nr:GAF domain-containing protein [Candidatus Rokubacteria bacterium]